MTKSQEQRMNELFEVYKSVFPIKYSEAALELIKDDFKAGYQAAMKEAEVLVEALEFECGNRCSDLKPCNAKEALKKFKGEINEI